MRVSFELSDAPPQEGIDCPATWRQSVSIADADAQTDELSLCAQPRRGGCYVNEIEGKSVHHVANFSKPRGASLTT